MFPSLRCLLEQSLADQEAKCRRYLQSLGLGDVEIIVIAEAAITGELARHPGIDKLWTVLENKHTRLRIARLIEGRWERGLLVNQTIRSGYVRVPAHAADENAAASERFPDTVRKSGAPYQQLRSPFIDRRDDWWTTAIRRAFEMCANREPDWRIAAYLNEAGLPRSSTARNESWLQQDIRYLISDPIYHGVEEYRHKHCVKRLRTGKTQQVATSVDKVWRRQVPHLV